MTTNPFGAGIRPWARWTAAKIAAATSTVLGKGELLVDDAGHAYVPDGVTPIAGLSPLATLAQVLAQPTVALTAAGTMTAGGPNTVDATAGPMTLVAPVPTKIGQLLPIERLDATTNAVTLSFPTGATLRGATATITMNGVGAAYEGLLFVAETLTSWRPVAGHKPKAWLDKLYQRGMGVAVATDPQFAGGMSTTNTAAQNLTALAAACAASNNVYIPAGTYPWTTGFTIPNQVTVRGVRSAAYTEVPTTGTILSCSDATASGWLLHAGNGILENISLVGAGYSSATQHDGLYANGTHCYGVMITRCRNGINGYDSSISSSYQGGLFFDLNIQTNYGDGIINVRDSTFLNCTVNANGGAGLNLQNGANDNQFVGGKLEWNNGVGFGSYKGAHNRVDTIIDRNGKAGVSMSNTTQCYVDGIIRRNGRLATAGSADDCQISSENDTDLVVRAVTQYGANDDGTGTATPTNCVRYNGGTRVLFFGGALGGYNPTSGAAVVIVGAGDVSFLGNTGLGSATQRINQTRVRVATSSGTLAPATSASASTTLTLTALTGTYNVGELYKLTIRGRNPSNGARFAGELPFQVSREGSNASISVGTLTNLIGTVLGTTGATVNVTLAVDTTGTVLTVTLANTSTSVTYTMDVSVVGV